MASNKTINNQVEYVDNNGVLQRGEVMDILADKSVVLVDPRSRHPTQRIAIPYAQWRKITTKTGI